MSAEWNRAASLRQTGMLLLADGSRQLLADRDVPVQFLCRLVFQFHWHCRP